MVRLTNKQHMEEIEFWHQRESAVQIHVNIKHIIKHQTHRKEKPLQE